MDENRVQEKENGNLYPIQAGKWTKTGYRRRFLPFCTRDRKNVRCAELLYILKLYTVKRKQKQYRHKT